MLNVMLNVGSNPASTRQRGLYQNWLFQLMAVFAVGVALAFVGCGTDDETTDEPEESLVPEEEIITVDGRDVIILEGKLNADKTLSAAYDYLLRGAVFVEGGATLTIEPGVKIFGEQASNGTLIIAQGSKIIADGTPDAPIIMSSDAAIGSRARGQWGGLIINGSAPTNQGVTFGEGDTGAFGGNNPSDSSGTLRYLRLEFAGIEFSPDNELNGIAFQGCRIRDYCGSRSSTHEPR